MASMKMESRYCTIICDVQPSYLNVWMGLLLCGSMFKYNVCWIYTVSNIT